MIVDNYKMMLKALKGDPWGRALFKESQQQLLSPTKFITDYASSPEENSSPYFNKPIFILSAGWRSGSTLLQRMLLKNPNLMVWGEPYHRSNLIDTMLEQLISLQSSWPPKEYYVSETGIHNEQWLANCWPQLQQMRKAHLAYWHSLFEVPANELSKSQWGIKEVRWGAKQVQYLKWLFPEAKFIFICRNPVDAYASFYQYPRAAFLRWPTEAILTARDFARMWLKLVGEFMAMEQSGVGVFVKYEQLKSEETIVKLENYIGPVYDPSRLSVISKPGEESKKSNVRVKNYLPKIEKKLLQFYLGKEINKYGYKL